MAGQTKRPTSVVMVTAASGRKKDGEDENHADWDEVYKGLVKTIEREGRRVKI
jgi:hypothetical protein